MLAPPVVDVCRELAAILPPGLQKVLLLSTGGESNDAALRLARLHIGRFEVVGLTGSYHGLTGGGASVTLVKVSVIDVATSAEVSIMGPPNAGEETLKRAVVRKLEYVLERQCKDASAPGGLLA